MRVDPKTSLVICLLLLGITFSSVMAFKSALRETEKMKLAGGFACSIIYTLLLTAISNFEAISFGSSKTISIIEVGLSLFVAEIVASSIHGVCVTTCFLFSALITYELMKVSNEFNGGEDFSVGSKFAEKTSVQQKRKGKK